MLRKILNIIPPQESICLQKKITHITTAAYNMTIHSCTKRLLNDGHFETNK